MAQKLYFLATDKQGFSDLWVTDGTTTVAVGGLGDRLGSPGVSGAALSGLGPASITAYGQDMIFGGADALNDGFSNGLWITSGAAAGTTEVGGVSQGMGKPLAIPGASPNGLAPHDFVTFGDKAIFFGTDATNFEGLWATDGTTANTVELGSSVQVAGRGPNWDPTNFAAFGSQVIFNAYDSTGDGTTYRGLWVTDGTVAGTVEIGGLQNAGIGDSYAGSFEAIDTLAFGGIAFFNAQNAEGDETLWITDGTASGTTELGGANNAGVVGANNTGLGDGFANAVQLGARVFFSGEDIDDASGLWVTDGTAAGTTEVGGLQDAGLTTYFQHPSSQGLNPVDLTVDGEKVLFNGRDALGDQELWVSDGTTLGTSEIGGQGVNGFLPHEALNGLAPQQITSLGGGKAVFIGYDSSNNQNSGKPTLWVTDGTFSGTQEIGGVDNLSVGGINSTGFSLTSSSVLVGGDGLAYFIGEDTAGQFVLWQTDGTQSGTKIDKATDGNAGSLGLTGVTGMALAAVPAAQDAITGGGTTVNLNNIPGETLNISSSNGVYTTVNGSDGVVNLSLADAYIIGAGVLATLSVGSAVGLYATNGVKDSVFGNKGAVTLNGAQASVTGEKNTVTFANGTNGNIVYLNDTHGAADTVNGSNGIVYLTNAQAIVNGGGDSIYFSGGGADDQVTLNNTGANWDNVYGSGGTVTLDDAISGIVGGGDTVNLTGTGDIASLWNTGGVWDNVNGSHGTIYLNNAIAGVVGGGDTIDFASGSGDAASLWNTAGVWDNVNGSNGTIYLNHAITGVVGGADTVDFVTGTDNIASLWNTGGAWDNVNGSNGTVYLNNAITGVIGGADTIDFASGAGDVASLWNTGGAWDNVNGANGTVYLNHAITGVVGGGDTVDFATGTDNIASLWNTGGAWDNVNGSNNTLFLNNAITGVVGGGDTIDFASGAGDAASLWNTNGVWDNVNGANGIVYLNNALSGVVGGGDTVYFNFGSGNAASLWNTGASANTIDNVGGVTGVVFLNNAQANVNGSGDGIDFVAGSDIVTVSGSSETFELQPLSGHEQISGYSSATDQMNLSASQFGTSWTNFFANDVSQSGANTTLITDPNSPANQLTLVGVNKSSLLSGNFHFS